MTSDDPMDRLAHFFSGVTQYTFETQLGVADPELVDYVSGLLIRFVRNDSTLPRSVVGKPIEELDEMLGEAERRLGEARRRLHRQIGDFALFWAGMFPEALRRTSRLGDHDQFHEYCAQGKLAYLMAARIEPVQREEVSSELLVRLGERFELCAYGLREIRREWEQQDGDPDLPRTILLN